VEILLEKRHEPTSPFSLSPLLRFEFLLGDALDRGADTAITARAVQSNHARQTAAACARLGMGCELFLKEAAPGRGESYGRSGNVLLDRILGAKVHILPGSSDAEAAME
jgi:1-aminocyclopropane-1-carboxylate deaminase/D-cysteine desulfhydrase-like pyridoxal-dependent ACC family enzyme